MDTHHISFSYKARYCSEGVLSPNTKKVWIIFHGYGQLASYFIKKFQILHAPDSFLIAPEGLSRFYLERFSGRVGATWMTKEDRLTDIANYLSYLNHLYDHIIRPNVSTEVEISLLGFSQGCATLARWVVESNLPFKNLIFWSGVFPPDLDFLKGEEAFEGKKVYMVYGTDDPFLNESSLENNLSIVKKLNLRPTMITFKGVHEIHQETLNNLLASMD